MAFDSSARTWVRCSEEQTAAACGSRASPAKNQVGQMRALGQVEARPGRPALAQPPRRSPFRGAERASQLLDTKADQSR